MGPMFLAIDAKCQNYFSGRYKIMAAPLVNSILQPMSGRIFSLSGFIEGQNFLIYIGP